MLRKLLSHAAIYGLSAQVPRLAGVLALPLVTPFLTTTDYGVAGVVTAFVSALGVAQSLGLSVVLVNSFMKHPVRYTWIWRQLHGFITLWSLGYGLLLGLVLYFVIPEAAQENKLTIVLLHCLPAMFFTSTDIQFNLYHQLSQRPLPVAVRSFVIGVTGVALNIYTIRVLQLGYMGWFYSNFIAITFGFLLNSYSVYLRQQLWPIFNFKWYRIKGALRVSVPVIPHNLSFFLLDTSDRVVMSLLGVPLQAIGFYNVASNFGSYFSAAGGAVVQAATPFYVQYYNLTTDVNAALQARRMTFMLQIGFLLVTTVACLWMREIFEVLIRNDELQQAYPLAIIILMGYNFRPMYLAVINLLALREKTNQLWKISFMAGVGNVVLNFIFIPVYGYQAAAFTTFAALMYMGYAGYFLKEYQQLALVKYYPLVWLAVTVLLLGGVYALATGSLPLKAIITLLILFVLIVQAARYKLKTKSVPAA